MKLCELEKGNKFKVVLFKDCIEFKTEIIKGEFLGMDGMYGKVLLDGFEEIQYLLARIEVEKIK